MNSLRGPEGFDTFYGEMYGERWPRLKDALLVPRKKIALINPFSKFKLSEHPLKVSGITLPHELQADEVRPSMTEDGYLNFFLMDAASVLSVEALNIQPGEKVADVCASPGGHSYLCALKLKSKGLLVSNDRSASRRATIQKIFNDYFPRTEQKNLKVTGQDASKWSLYEKSAYDKVLVDAPCSSEKLPLEDSKEMSLWSEGRSKAISVSQLAILASAIDMVKVGGLVAYSTCTLSLLENDEVIRKLHSKKMNRFEVLNLDFPFGEPTEFGWRILPDNSGWGPFYLSVMRRLR